MSKWSNGLLAGLVATIVLSVLMVVKSALGFLPAVDAIEMLRGLGATHFGLPDSVVAAWIVHAAIGVVIWGLVFAHTYETWPGSPAMKGVVFAIMIWLLTMSMFMPMVGADPKFCHDNADFWLTGGGVTDLRGAHPHAHAHAGHVHGGDCCG